jgi:hypothetical protein
MTEAFASLENLHVEYMPHVQHQRSSDLHCYHGHGLCVMQVYFNESIAEARKAVDACLSAWTSLLSELSEDERTKLQRRCECLTAVYADGCMAALLYMWHSALRPKYPIAAVNGDDSLLQDTIPPVHYYAAWASRWSS